MSIFLLSLRYNWKILKKAVSILETGLDYLVDDKALEINFYIQLGQAYSGLGNNAKKESYFIKADKLVKKGK